MDVRISDTQFPTDPSSSSTLLVDPPSQGGLATYPPSDVRPVVLPSPSSPRIRPPVSPAESPVHRWLARGEAIIPAEGNLAWQYRVAKRAFDVVGSLAILTVFSPIILITFLVLMVTTRGKPLFRQVRLGYRGRPFAMYKFRTMVVDAEQRREEVENEKDGPIFKNRKDSRITRLGQFLRSTSLDETPQLFSVLRGHMSLVGPRPPIGQEVAEYRPWQRRRLAVKPGLTCLWQVSGRSEIGFEDWVRMDIWYVRNQNLRTDQSLLLRTPASVLSRRGAY